jgi:Carbohydrate-binding module family 5/12
MTEPNWVALGTKGGPVDYAGAWAAGTSYNPGDVVNYNGVQYIAVNPSVGQTPPTVLPLVSYATTLPASPVDQQEAILVDSLTAPTYRWRFRYNAGSASTYKWEYIGGTPATSYIEASESVPSTSYTELTTVGPSVTVPRAGEYDIEFWMWVQIGAQTGWVTVSAAVAVNSLPNWTSPICQPFANVYNQAGIQYLTTSAFARTTITAAGSILKPGYAIVSMSGTGAPTVGRRRLVVTPVRVS